MMFEDVIRFFVANEALHHHLRSLRHYLQQAGLRLSPPEVV